MNSPADHRSASRPYTARERWARWAPVSNKETSIAMSVIRDARASRRACRLAIGLSTPPKKNPYPIELGIAQSNGCQQPDLLRGSRARRESSTAPWACRIRIGVYTHSQAFASLAPPHLRIQQCRGLPSIYADTPVGVSHGHRRWTGS